jgi:ABC-type Fe3+ transport system permease subunit
MRLKHFNYFWWDSEVRRIIFSGTFLTVFFLLFFLPPFLHEVSEGREERLRRNTSYIFKSGWRRWHDLLLWCALVNTRMRSGRFLGDISEDNLGCQRTNSRVGQQMMYKNGRKLLRRWRIISWTCTCLVGVLCKGIGILSIIYKVCVMMYCSLCEIAQRSCRDRFPWAYFYDPPSGAHYSSWGWVDLQVQRHLTPGILDSEV